MEFLTETVIFAVGILILDLFMLQFLSTSLVGTKKISLADVSSIVITYPIIMSAKYISAIVAIYFRFQNGGFLEKVIGMLSCLIISPISFSIIFIFLAGIKLSLYTGLAGKQVTGTIQNIIIIGLGLAGIYAVNKTNVYLLETAQMQKREIIRIIFVNSLPLQKIKSTDGYNNA